MICRGTLNTDSKIFKFRGWRDGAIGHVTRSCRSGGGGGGTWAPSSRPSLCPAGRTLDEGSRSSICPVGREEGRKETIARQPLCTGGSVGVGESRGGAGTQSSRSSLRLSKGKDGREEGGAVG